VERLEGPFSVPRTLEFVAVPLLFLALYLVFVKLSQPFGRGSLRFGQYTAAYAYSLVPIAVAYQVAHYFTYLLIQGQATIALISDPSGGDGTSSAQLAIRSTLGPSMQLSSGTRKSR
jgi:hypothetical protein